MKDGIWKTILKAVIMVLSALVGGTLGACTNMF